MQQICTFIMNLFTLLKHSIYISTGTQCLFQNVIKKASQFFCRVAFFTTCTVDCLKCFIWLILKLHYIRLSGLEKKLIRFAAISQGCEDETSPLSEK